MSEPAQVHDLIPLYRRSDALLGQWRGSELHIGTPQETAIVLRGELAQRLYFLQEDAFTKPLPKEITAEFPNYNPDPVCYHVAHCAFGYDKHPKLITPSTNRMYDIIGRELSITEALQQFLFPFLFQLVGEIYIPQKGTEDEYRYHGVLHVGMVVGCSRYNEAIVFEKRGMDDLTGVFRRWEETLAYYQALGSGNFTPFFASKEEVWQAYKRMPGPLEELEYPTKL